MVVIKFNILKTKTKMKKKFVTYTQGGTVKKAVLDENLYKQYSKNPTITNLTVHTNETLMERYYAEQLGVSNGKNFLLG
jgi:hypothetical protein